MRDIYQAVTSQMMDRLQRGVVPWRQPWKTIPAANLVSTNTYQGINALLLNSASYGCPYWVTYKLVFYRYVEVSNSDSSEDCRRIPLSRYSNVLNLEQRDRIEIPTVDKEISGSPLSIAEKIVSEFTLCPIQGETSAAYFPSQDCIRMPHSSTFGRDKEYFHVLFHEMGHSTRLPSRLARPDVEPGNVHYGSEPCSKEELIAEMTACFIPNEAGTLSEVVFTNSSAYLSSWLKALNDDSRLVLSAASQAQRAADLIRNRRMEITSETEVPRIQTPQEQGRKLPQLESFSLSMR